ncbi:unnamed protein product [Linum trigynum]|uniref:Uncharacterized protein n=1 Tax=Linum trigynum TaxID=586398 RepID=A0AAV2DEG1_9ROSI
MSISQLTASGSYVVFGPIDVKVYQSLQPTSDSIMRRQKLESVYVMLAEVAAYVHKTRRNETSSLWHARLEVGYKKFRGMMKNSMLKRLTQLDICEVIVCVGCQYRKAHKLPYEDSKFKYKLSMEPVHSDVFRPVKKTCVWNEVPGYFH